MSADFNAGSIEGTLDLDTSPFRAGLTKAREDARSFEGKTIDPKVTLDRGEFETKKAVTKAELERLNHERVEPKVGLDITGLETKVAMIHGLLAKSLDTGGLGKAMTGPAFAIGRLITMIGLFASLAAAAGPATAALIGFGGAAGAAFGGAGIALALFGASVKSALEPVLKANKAGKELSGTAGLVQKHLKALTGAWGDLQKSVQPQMLKFLNVAFAGLAGILPKLHPLLKATTVGLTDVEKHVFALTRTPLFEHFLHQLTGFMRGLTAGLGPVLVNVLKTFMHMFSALRPLMSLLGRGIEDITHKAAQLSGALAHGGIKPFVAEVKGALPILGKIISDVFHGLVHLGQGLAPLAGPALKFIDALVVGIGSLNIAPLAHGFASMLGALQPLIPVLVVIVNTLLGPLGSLLSALASGPVAQISHSLLSELRPALGSLKSILNDLVQPLADFLGSIANLANPTGISLLAKVLKALKGPVHTLAPAFSNLAVAIENVIDNGITILLPLVGPLGKALGHAATFAAAFANGLAGILKHKTVSGIILGMAGAIYLMVKAYKAYRAIMLTIEFLQAAYATAMLGSAAAMQAGGASVVIYIARMVALKVAQAAAAVASGVLTAAQWLLNAAMDANPIGLVVLALAALVAGLVYAYTHSKEFRKIVSEAFHAVLNAGKVTMHALGAAVEWVVNFIRQHWQLLLAIMMGPIGIVAGFVISHFNQIKGVVQRVMSDVAHFVSTGVSEVVGWFESLPGRIGALAGQMFNAGKSLMSAIFHGLESAAGAVGGFAGNIASAIWNDLKGVLNSILPHSLSINKGPIHINVPLFPMLAKGGVTTGPTLAGIGDNPGGREAVVPLDKYDLPKKGESAAAARQTHADNQRVIDLLTNILHHLAKGTDNAALADAIGAAVGKHNDATMRRMIQMARAT